MKYNVDQDLCIGCGMCAALCPELFAMNENGQAEAFGEGDGSEALGSCPAGAISEEAMETVEETVAETETTEAPARYVCSVCGYVYDPEKGDPDGGIEPGTAFEDIPEDWVCPLCGVGKNMFTKQE